MGDISNRRGNAPKVVVPLCVAFMGVAALFNVGGSPGFAAYRSIDVVRLLASGMCFGAAIASLAILWFGGSGR
jgi:hypothetical protein